MAKKDKAASARPAGEPAKGFKRVVRIAAKTEKGFWRAGVKHPHIATDHSIDRFDDAQLDALVGEPMLTVAFVDVEDTDAAKEPEKRD